MRDKPNPLEGLTADQRAVRAVEIIGELKSLSLTRGALRYAARTILEPAKHRLSPEGIVRISEGQKRRWREYRAKQFGAPQPETAPDPKILRHVSYHRPAIIPFIGPTVPDLILGCDCQIRKGGVTLCSEATRLWNEYGQARYAFEHHSPSLVDLANALLTFRNHFKLQQEESTVKVSSLFARAGSSVPRPDKVGVPVVSKVPESPTPNDPNGDLPMAQLIRHGHEIVVDCKLAVRILNECGYERQRQSKANRHKARVEQMRHGEFHGGHGLPFALFQDRLVLMNGYTRLGAIVETKKAYRFMPLIRECKTMGEVAAFYAEFDEGVGIRTIRERFEGYYESGKLKPKEEEALATAVVCIAAGLRKPEPTGDAHLLYSTEKRGDLIRHWGPLAAKYFREVVSDAPSNRKGLFRRAAILAPALLILEHSPKKAWQFLGGLAGDSGLMRDDPRKAMLLALEISDGKSFPKDVRIFAAAWNAFAAGQQRTKLRIRMDEAVRLAEV